MVDVTPRVWSSERENEDADATESVLATIVFSSIIRLRTASASKRRAGDALASYHQRSARSRLSVRPASYWRAAVGRAVTCVSGGWREELSRLVNRSSHNDPSADEMRGARCDEAQGMWIELMLSS